MVTFLSPLPGLRKVPFSTHGLRRGLHSFAAFAAGTGFFGAKKPSVLADGLM